MKTTVTRSATEQTKNSGTVKITGLTKGEMCGSDGIEGDILACTEAMKRERAAKG